MSHHDDLEEYVTASEEMQNLRVEKETLCNLIDDAIRDLRRPDAYRSREDIAQFLVDVLAKYPASFR
jgi:hypothetical protein